MRASWDSGADFAELNSHLDLLKTRSGMTDHLKDKWAASMRVHMRVGKEN